MMMRSSRSSRVRCRTGCGEQTNGLTTRQMTWRCVAAGEQVAHIRVCFGEMGRWVGVGVGWGRVNGCHPSTVRAEA